MGKASSNKKVQRAARAAASSRGASERRELGFPLTIAAIVILGIALVAFSRETREANAESPTLRDHWHSAYAIYECDELVPEFESAFDPDGIHSHQDGVIHVHPFTNAVTGGDAEMGVFLDAMGAEIDDTSMTTNESGLIQAGADCDGEPTVLRVARWDADDLAAGPIEVFTEDFGEIEFLKDREAFTFAFLPADAEIPLPPQERFDALEAATGLPVTTPQLDDDLIDQPELLEDPNRPELEDDTSDAESGDADDG